MNIAKTIPLIAAVLLMTTSCSKPVEQAQDRVDTGKVLAANQNAALIYQNAVNYSAQCQVNGVTINAGRYCGKLGTGATTYSLTGDSADFEAAQNTYTNGSTGGYYCVMIGDQGKAEAAYWCGTADLSQEEFPPMSEPFKVSSDKVIGRYPEGAEAQ